jgi:hypothetical protein
MIAAGWVCGSIQTSSPVNCQYILTLVSDIVGNNVTLIADDTLDYQLRQEGLAGGTDRGLKMDRG